MLINQARKKILHEVNLDRHRRWHNSLPYFVMRTGTGYDVRLSSIKNGDWSPKSPYLGTFMEVIYNGKISLCRWAGVWYADFSLFNIDDNPYPDDDYICEPNGGAIPKVGKEGKDDGFGLDRCEPLTDKIRDKLDSKLLSVTLKCLPPPHTPSSWKEFVEVANR